MTQCNTDGCLAIIAFVKSLMKDRLDVVWSVFEEANDLNVYVRLWLDKEVKTLSLQEGQTRGLDAQAKDEIARWLDSVF